MPADDSRALRADARRNRERIVEAAREVFAEQGLEASCNEVARRADVGIATLLRRFPDRDELIAAAFADRIAAYSTAIQVALANDDDPWGAFCTFITDICALQATDRAFADVLTMTLPPGAMHRDEVDRIAQLTGELIKRAKASGGLRLDFEHHDIPLVLMANAGVVNATRDTAPEAWRRVLSFMLQSFAAPGAPIPPLAEAPCQQQVALALNRGRD